MKESIHPEGCIPGHLVIHFALPALNRLYLRKTAFNCSF
jgi:hypothetical protein